MSIYMPKITAKYWSISEILTIKDYWNLFGREPFLAITWEPDFTQACGFCRILMNHKNFHLPQIPDKINDVIFLKSPKTMFLGHFWPFLVIFAQWRFLPKTVSVTHNYIWAPNTMQSFRKNWRANFEKTYGQKDRRAEGWTDRQKNRPYFIGPFWPRPGAQQCKLAPTVTVLCAHNFACPNVHTKPFYRHKNECIQILNLSCPGVRMWAWLQSSLMIWCVNLLILLFFFGISWCTCNFNIFVNIMLTFYCWLFSGASHTCLSYIHPCEVSWFWLKTHSLTARHKILAVNWHHRQFPSFDLMKDIFMFSETKIIRIDL